MKAILKNSYSPGFQLLSVKTECQKTTTTTKKTKQKQRVHNSELSTSGEVGIKLWEGGKRIGCKFMH